MGETTDTLDSLLHAVFADRRDVATRLVYADALEECATTEPQQARAAFIRLQCWLTGKEPGYTLPYPNSQSLTGEAREWDRLASDLLFRCGSEQMLFGPESAALDPPTEADSRFRWVWRNGWPDDFTANWLTWLESGAALHAAIPFTRVTIEGAPPLVVRVDLPEEWREYTVTVRKGYAHKMSVAPRKPGGFSGVPDSYFERRAIESALAHHYPGVWFNYTHGGLLLHGFDRPPQSGKPDGEQTKGG